MRIAAAAIASLFAATIAAQAAVHAGGSDPAARASGNDVMTVTNFVDVPAEEPPAEEPPPPGGYDQNAVEAANNAIAAAERAAADAATAAGETPTAAWLLEPDRWVGGAEEAGAVWYFDTRDAARPGRPLRVRLRTDETSDPAHVHNNTARLAELDCEGRRYRILRTTHYDDAGRASEANERGAGTLVPIPDNSVIGEVADNVCRFAADPRSASSNAM